MRIMRLQQQRTERRAEGERDDQRDRRPGRDGDSELAEELPEMPDRKADGTNTPHTVSAMETSAPPTSSIVRWAASFGVMLAAMLRSTFSTTTIASSATMPTASTRPNSDRFVRLPKMRILMMPLGHTEVEASTCSDLIPPTVLR